MAVSVVGSIVSSVTGGDMALFFVRALVSSVSDSLVGIALGAAAFVA